MASCQVICRIRSILILRPVYDALDEALGVDQAQKLLDRNIIEVVPLAYMRGRTLDDAYIILDEAQNTTPQ